MRTGRPDELIRWLLEQDRDKLFDVKRHREKRSLTQNGYYWVLNDKLASVLRMPRHELHEQLIKRYSTCDVVTVLEEVPVENYFEYYDVFAHGEMHGRKYKHVRVYKGSSKMDSAEFARLLDGIIDECRAQGIDTMTPDEAARLEYL